MKAILVGRHTGAEIPGVEIIEQQAITWPATAAEAQERLAELAKEATEKKLDAIVLQNVPGQLAAAIAAEAAEEGITFQCPPLYVVISKPGPRPANVVETIVIDDAVEAAAVERVLKVANPRAKVSVGSADNGGFAITVTVDPPMLFEFSHLERLL